MTRSAHPTVPQDFSIQVAENEGMPPRPDLEDIPPHFACPGRQTGTHRLSSLKGKVVTGGAWAARKKPMRHGKKTTRHPLARLISKLPVVAGIIASLAFPIFAQDGTGPMLEDGEVRSYGGG
jgi:hypothetical protein